MVHGVNFAKRIFAKKYLHQDSIAWCKLPLYSKDIYMFRTFCLNIGQCWWAIFSSEHPVWPVKGVVEAASELRIFLCSIWLYVHRVGPYIQGGEKQIVSMGNPEFILILLCANYCIIFRNYKHTVLWTTVNILFAYPISHLVFTYIHLCCCIKYLPIPFSFSLMFVHF